jgi:hypothetical protein
LYFICSKIRFAVAGLGIKNIIFYLLCDFQKWINAFTEHAAFSTHYLTQGHVEFDDSDDEDQHIKPLGSMQVTFNGIFRGKLLCIEYAPNMEYHCYWEIKCYNTVMNHHTDA